MINKQNFNVKFLFLMLAVILILSSISILNFQSIYSQSTEDEKSLNCKDNQNQSLYVSNVDLVNKSGNSGPVTNDLPGFHYVKKFDSNGNLITAWGTKGTGPGQFLHAHGIAVDSKGHVYVSEAEKCNIQKFDSNGNFITMWGTKGTGSNQFIKPWGISVDSKDNVYVSDQDNPLVQKFNNDGKFLLKWGSYGTGEGQFVHLHDITVDSKGFVYVTDGRNNSRVEKFDSNGNFVAKWGSY